MLSRSNTPSIPTIDSMTMPERRTRSPPHHGSKDHEDVSDDDTIPHSHGRDKFRRERSLERNTGDADRYDYKKRPRSSPVPSDEHRHKRHVALSPPHGMRGHGPPVPRGARGQPRGDAEQGDRYVPNYDRDGYVPAPRYTHGPDAQHPVPGMNHPMMDMMMNNWSAIPRPPTVDPQQLTFLMPYKQFAENLRNTHARSYFTEEELHTRYTLYKHSFATRQLTEFFKINKEKIWFQEKYHPRLSLPREEDMKKRRRRYLESFLAAIGRGEYDDVCYDGHPDQIPAQEAKEETTATQEESEEYENRLVIKTVPPTIPREKIIEMCSKVEGFDYLALSEPNISKKFHRVGWINFKPGTDIQAAHAQLDSQKVDDFIFHVAMNKKNQMQSRIPRFTFDISNSHSRLKIDLEQAKELAKRLEQSLGEDVRGIDTVVERAKHVIKEQTDVKMESLADEGVNSDGELPEKSQPEQELEKKNIKKELDMIIAYLRNVHMYCYYCGLECDSVEELSRKCVEPHYRRVSNERGTVKYPKNDKAVYWLHNLDQRIDLKLHTPTDNKLESLGGKVLESELSNYVKTQVHKEHEAKYKCKVGDCSKAFKGYDFVEKHIFSKHPEEIEQIKEEVNYFNNYVCDPNHMLPVANSVPGPTPNKQHNVQYIPTPNGASGGGGGAGGAGGAGVGGGAGGPSSPFMMNTMNGMRAPHGMMPMQAAPGSPWKQIPRIGFGDNNNSWNSLNMPGREASRPSGSANNGAASRAISMDLDAFPRDPRQVKSYVDLDAPAEGDANIAFY
ncbi:C2H2-type zinc finger transcription factor [Phycomyces blakesleeanus]